MEEKKKFDLKFWHIIVCMVVFMILMGAASTYADLSRIPHRDEGIWAIETLTSTGEVSGVGRHKVFANGRYRNSQHNISFFIDELEDYSGTDLTQEELAQWSVGDKCTVTREVYYLKPGFRIFYKDSISK